MRKAGLSATIAAALLCGCAAGGTYNYADMPVAMKGVATSGTIAIAVHDIRPNVVPGVPLATDMRDALARALKERGATVIPVAVTSADTNTAARAKLVDTKAQRQVLVTLREWKTDTMMSTDLHYDTTVAVFDQSGNQLAHHSLKGKDELGSLGLSPKEGISRATARKLDAMFDDSRIAGALK